MKYDGSPHCQSAYIYACHVTKGHKPACKWERLACQRFLDDLERTDITFNEPAAEKVCNFIELLPHTKGRWSGRKFILESWQCFIVVNLFGFLNDKGLRVRSEAYIKVPRKNGKSNLMAAIGLYMLCADGEHGAECLSGATTERQAWYVFSPARLMAKKTPALCEKYGIEVNASNINILSEASKFEPVVGDGGGDGGNPSCAIIDEFMEHQNDTMVDTMRTGQHSRQAALLLKITTAGTDTSGPCYIEEQECQKLLGGVFTDDRMFTIMYGIDDDDDWTTEAALIKANPNWNISFDGDTLLAAQRAAIRTARKQNTFKRKHLNKWVGAHTAWLNMEKWSACAADLHEADYDGDVCIFGLDLSSKIDLTAFVKVYTKLVDDKTHYYAFSKFYLPEDTIYADTNKHYQGWVADGHIIATDGAEIDLNEIQHEVMTELDSHPATEVAYDPWHAKQLAQSLEAQGVSIVEYRPTRANMNEAMRELEAAIESGRFHFDGNPVMSWCASNLIAQTDYQDNIFPRKDKNDNDKKIDGVVAVLMAVGRAVHTVERPSLDIMFA